jgi:hypothetical protein
LDEPGPEKFHIPLAIFTYSLPATTGCKLAILINQGLTRLLSGKGMYF